jgi:hypothetical protein
MDKPIWRKYLGLVALAVVLAVVISPELRVLLFFVDSIGMEIFVLLLVTQFRATWLGLLPAAALALARTCSAAALIGQRALKAMPAATVLAPFDRAFCQVFLLASFGLGCSTQRAPGLTG